MSLIFEELSDPDSARLRGFFRWCVDSPGFGALRDRGVEGVFDIKGWVLGPDFEDILFATKDNAGVIRCFPLNVKRPDVVRLVLLDDPFFHERVISGFDYSLSVAENSRFGFACSLGFFWFARIRSVV